MTTIIYELGVNWCNRFNGAAYAKQLIDHIQNVDPQGYVKFQWFDPDRLATSDASFADGRNQREVLRANEPSWDDVVALAAYARSKGLKAGCTVFCEEDIQKLAKHQVFDFYKIGSPDCIDLKMVYRYLTLMRHDGAGEELVISTGGASQAEIARLLRYIETEVVMDTGLPNFNRGQPWITIMHCVSKYPAESLALGEMINLAQQVGMFKERLRERAYLGLGFSIHTPDLETLSVLARCRLDMIEVHISESDIDVDAPVSFDPRDADRIQSLKSLFPSTWSENPDREDREAIRRVRRYWVASKPISKGEQLTPDNTRIARCRVTDGRFPVSKVLVDKFTRSLIAGRDYLTGDPLTDVTFLDGTPYTKDQEQVQ